MRRDPFGTSYAEFSAICMVVAFGFLVLAYISRLYCSLVRGEREPWVTSGQPHSARAQRRTASASASGEAAGCGRSGSDSSAKLALCATLCDADGDGGGIPALRFTLRYVNTLLQSTSQESCFPALLNP